MDNKVLENGWTKVKLKSIVRDFHSGGTPKSSNESYWGGDIEWVTSKKLVGTILDKGEKKITEEGLNNSSTKVVPNGNLLIGSRVGVGKCVINKIDIAINQDVTAAKISQDEIDPLFIVYQFKSKKVQRYIKSCLKGSTIKGINRGDLKKIPLNLPPLPEQQKIASILSTVQDAIEQTEAVIQATRELKKSMMKHLFTYGPVPVDQTDQVELEETDVGLLPTAWTIEKSGELIKNITDGTHDSPKKEDAGYPLIKSKQIKNGRIIKEEIDYYINKDDFEKINRRSNVDKFDILISMIGTIGEVALVREKPEFAIKNVGLFKMSGDKILAEYIFYWLQSLKAQNYLQKNISGTSQKYVTLTLLRSFPVPLPDKQTQIKICKAINSVEEKLNNEIDKKKSLETLFNSLLESLMTAKIRVV